MYNSGLTIKGVNALAQYKIYQNEAKTIVVIKGWFIVFFISALFLWAVFVSLLSIIWNVFDVYAFISDGYLYYVFLCVILLASFYLAYQLNKKLIMERTKKIIDKGFVLIKEVEARNEKNAISSVFPLDVFEPPAIGFLGIIGCSFILVLLLALLSFVFWKYAKELTIPPISSQATVTDVKYIEGSGKVRLSYYQITALLEQNDQNNTVTIMVNGNYKVGDKVVIHYFEKNYLGKVMIEGAQISKDITYFPTIIMLFIYFLIINAASWVQERKRVAVVKG